MSIGLSFTGKIDSPQALLEAAKALAEERKYHLAAGEGGMKVAMCPLGGELGVLWKPEGGPAGPWLARGGCVSTPAGPGLHRAAVELVDALPIRGLRVEDETGFFQTRDFLRMREEHFYPWLRTLVDICRQESGKGACGMRLCWDLEQYAPQDIPDTVVTPMGRFRLAELVELVEQIHGIEGLERIRLGSLEPRIVTPEAVRRLAALPKLCPHFHLSLQSGCDATLKRMNRHYTTGEYYKSVELLREYFDTPAITTDVIAGFPGETEEEFAQTKEFLEKVHFYDMHVFKYSRRAGTAADSMPDQVPEPVKAKRSAELIALRGRQSEEFRRRYIGKEAEVLLEEQCGINGRTYCIGHTKDYVKVAVDVTDREEKDVPAINTLAKVRIQDFLTEEILM